MIEIVFLKNAPQNSTDNFRLILQEGLSMEEYNSSTILNKLSENSTAGVLNCMRQIQSIEKSFHNDFFAISLKRNCPLLLFIIFMFSENL